MYDARHVHSSDRSVPSLVACTETYAIVTLLRRFIPAVFPSVRLFWFQVRKLKGSDEHLSVERAGGGQEVLVSYSTHTYTQTHTSPGTLGPVHTTQWTCACQ